MKFFIAMLILIKSMQVFAVPLIMFSGARVLRKDKNLIPGMISCAEQLQHIFKKSNVQHSFHALAQDYLADFSPGKKLIRDISVFQALSKDDASYIRDLFCTQMNVVAELWLMKNTYQASDNGLADIDKEHLLHRYLCAELFDEHKLPFDISYPRVTEIVPLPFFYFGKTIRSIYEDTICSERHIFQEKKKEIGVKMKNAKLRDEKLLIQKEYLELIQYYYSPLAYENRVIQTSDHIACYTSRLMEAGERIDTACAILIK